MANKPSLLDLPAELRLNMIEKLLRPYDSDSCLYCCDEHCPRPRREFGAPKTEEDLADEARTDLVNFATTCQQLATEVEEVLYSRLCFDFCVCDPNDDIGRNPRTTRFIRFARHLFVNLNLDHDDSDNTHLVSMANLAQKMRKICVIIDLPPEGPPTFFTALVHLGGQENFHGFIQMLKSSLVLQSIVVHVYTYQPTTRDLKMEQWHIDSTIGYLQALENLPDHITVSINIKGMHYDNDDWLHDSVHERLYTGQIVSLPFAAESKEAKYVEKLTNSPRSKEFNHVPSLKHEWRKLCRWMPNAFSFPDLSIRKWKHEDGMWYANIDPRDKDFVTETHAVASKMLRNAWQAHRSGDIVGFQKNKDNLFELWKIWIAKIGDSAD